MAHHINSRSYLTAVIQSFITGEYAMSLESMNVDVSYAYCLSEFLEKKMKSEKLKFVILNKMFLQDGITVFYGENIDYFDKLNAWINNF